MGSFLSYLTHVQDSTSFESDVVNPETGISPRQQKEMKRTWDQYIRPNLIDVGVQIMLSLLDAHPHIKQFFPDFKDLSSDKLKKSKKFHAHCQMIMSTIDNAVNAFLNDDVELFITILKLTGERHAKRSNGEITAEHFNCVKDPLIANLKNRMESNWNNQNNDWIIETWTQAVDKMIQMINSGINEYKSNIQSSV